MTTLDAWILRRFEVFCHFTQRLCGITSVEWNRLMIMIISVTIIDNFPALVHARRFYMLALFCLFLLAWAMASITADSAPLGYRNIREVTDVSWRILWLHVLAIDIAAVLFGAYSWDGVGLLAVYIAHYYFAAVTDLPPGESKVKEALRSIQTALSARPLQQGA